MVADKSIGYTQALETIEVQLLGPGVARDDVVQGCNLAKSYHIPVICVKPCYVHLVVEMLRGSKVKIATVIGYPFGDIPTSIKINEAKLALTEGVLELNVVANTAYLLDGNEAFYQKDIEALCCLARMNGGVLNCILDCHSLSDAFIKNAAQIAEKMGAAWISPSSGISECDNELYYSVIKNAIDGKSQLKSMENVVNFESWQNRFDLGCRRISTRNPKALVESLQLQLMSQ